MAVLLAVVLTQSDAAPAHADLRLLPEPRRVTPGSGRLSLRDDVTIAVASGDSEDQFAAELLREEIGNACAVKARLVSDRSATIVLSREGAPAELGDEGYRIEAKASGVRVSARTAAGLFYGVQTLRQMVDSEGIPAATIDDSPALRWRGLQDDVSRGPVPTLETLERRIRTAAEFKLNLYVLYLEAAYAFRGHPLLAPPGGALTESDVRELVAFARRYHVTLVPEQQTTGHLSSVLRFERYADLAEVPQGSTLAPQPASYAFIRSLYDELAPLFPGPFLHIGADEIGEIGQGRTRARAEASGLGTVYLGHLKALRDLLQPYGKRLMFWGDACVDHPNLVRALPPDLVVASWCYEAKDDYSKWIRPFRDANLDLFVCPGAANWNRVFPNLDVALANIRGFIHEGQRAGSLGAITCVWADNGDALFDLNWYALAGSAAASWQEAVLDTMRLRTTFDWAFFRKPGTDVADAIALINEGNRLVRGVPEHEADLALCWENPVLNVLDGEIVGALEPVARQIRAVEEQAIERLERSRPHARRNSDVLDVYAFAARRMHSIGLRAMIAKQVPVLYRRLRANYSPQAPVLETRTLDGINSLLGAGRDAAVALRAEHERLWRRENRPYWLGNILALYDRDIQIWIDKLDVIRQCRLLIQLGNKLPTPTELGIAP